jgi:hypothetical protein
MFGYPQPECGNSVPASATRLLTAEWAPQCLISQGGGLLVSERGLACLVLLFSDKAVTKHFGCQPPAINASYCCNAEIFPAIDQTDKHHFPHRSGKAGDAAKRQSDV